MDRKLVNFAKFLPLVAAATLLGSCGSEPLSIFSSSASKETGAQAAGPPPGIPVEIALVNSTTVADTSEYVAVLEGEEGASIKPRVSGWVNRVLVKLGDRVSRGDSLLQIDPSRQQAVLESSIANIATAEADFNSAEAQLQSERDERSRLMAELDLNSERANLQNARANLLSQRQERLRLVAELDLNSERANLESAKANLLGERQERLRLVAELELNSERAKLEDTNASLRSQKAEKDRINAALEYQKLQQERYRELYQQGAVAKETFDEVTRDIKQAEAELDSQDQEIEAAEARVESSQKDLERRLKTLGAQIATQDEVIKAAEARVESAEKDLERQIKTLEAQIATQEEVINAAVASVASAEKDLERRIKTLEAQIASQEKLIQAQEARVKSVRGQVNRSRAEAVTEQVELQYYDVSAPIDGIVGDVSVKVGDFVDSQAQITSIRNNRTLEVNIDVPVDRLAEIKIGTPVEILSQQTGEVMGTSRVSFISPDAGSGTQTILVKAIYNNSDNRLRSDQLVRARIIWQRQPGLTVPTSAVQRIGAQPFVFLAVEQIVDGQQLLIASQKPVKLGSIQGQSYEVVSGLSASDRIVVSGVVKLRDGAPIADISQLNPPSGSQQSSP